MRLSGGMLLPILAFTMLVTAILILTGCSLSPSADVIRLVEAAFLALEDEMDDSFTSAELFSAVLTLTGKVVQVLLMRGADEPQVRAAVELVFPQQAIKTFNPRMN